MKRLFLLLIIIVSHSFGAENNVKETPPISYTVDTLTIDSEQYYLRALDIHDRYSLMVCHPKSDKKYTIIHGWFNFVSGPECEADSCYDSLEVFSLKENNQAPYVIAQAVQIQNQLLYRYCVLDSCCLTEHMIAHHGEALTQSGAYDRVRREHFVFAAPDSFYPDESSFKGDGETVVHAKTVEFVELDGDSLPQMKQYRFWWNGENIVRELLPPE